MLKDITLGQYYPAESPIHALDPRVKLAGTLIFIIAAFLAGNLPGYLILIAFLAIVIWLAKIPFRFMMRGQKSIIIILLISVSFNLFLTAGTPVADLPLLRHITWEGITRAGSMALRLILLVMGSSLMTLTTTPNALTDGLESGLNFLTVFHVPVHEIAMMMSIALRFIPILMEETDKIMKAQEARGADFTSGGLIARAKAMVPLLVPLFVSAFRRASDLAMALEARCYQGGVRRTRMKPLRYRKNDAIAYLVLAAFLTVMILQRVFL